MSSDRPDAEKIYVRAWRERRALSQTDLARLSHVSQFSISKIETAERKARPSTLRKLAEALGLEPEQLFRHPDELPAATRLTR